MLSKADMPVYTRRYYHHLGKRTLFKFISNLFKPKEPPRDMQFSNRKELLTWLHEYLPHTDAKRLADLAKHAIHLDVAEDTADIPAGASKIGGMPDFPPEQKWPHRPAYSYSKGHGRGGATKETEAAYALPFLAQINLAEMRGKHLPKTALPERGMLYFFYDVAAQPWGFDPADKPAAKVVYVAEASTLKPAIAGAGNEDLAPFKQAALTPKTVYHMCPPEGLACENLKLSPESQKSYWQFFEDYDLSQFHYGRDMGWPDAPVHQLTGWPEDIQNPMEVECALVTEGIYCGGPKAYTSENAMRILAKKNDWQLLLQLDSYERSGMMWGDAGRLFFWIKASDLRDGNFDNIWVILQCT